MKMVLISLGRRLCWGTSLLMGVIPLMLTGCGGGDGSAASSQGGSAGRMIASQYTIKDLGLLTGGTYSSALGMNDNGQVVGSGDSSLVNDEAFLYSSGKLTGLGGLPGYAESVADYINNNGEAVGDSSNNTLDSPCLFVGSKVTTFSLLKGYTEGDAFAINNSGTVVGEEYNADASLVHAFSYSSGTLTDLGSLGALSGYTESYATAINDNGTIVIGGQTIEDKSGDTIDHALLYSSGRLTDLGTLKGYSDADAYAINNSGTVVGDEYSADDSLDHAFSYSSGKMTDLGVLGGYGFSYATAINASGLIVGTCGTATTAALRASSLLSGQHSKSHFGPRRSSLTVKPAIDGSGSTAFVFGQGKMVDLESLLSVSDQSKWRLSEATGINASGQICGYGEVGYGTVNDQYHAFLLTPKS